MAKREWTETALIQLQSGHYVEVMPRGHSMRGKINDGDTVTLAPCSTQDLKVGDMVLARIQGRRYSHLVLHLILQRENSRFLIGSNHGREDGWIKGEHIFGKVIKVKPVEKTNQDKQAEIKTEAEFYQIALELKLCSVEEVMAWCDSVIMAEESVDDAIIEAALSGSKGRLAVSQALMEVQGDADTCAISRRFMRQLWEMVTQNPADAPGIAFLLSLLEAEFDKKHYTENYMESYSWDFECAEDNVREIEELTNKLIDYLKANSL